MTPAERAALDAAVEDAWDGLHFPYQVAPGALHAEMKHREERVEHAIAARATAPLVEAINNVLAVCDDIERKICDSSHGGFYLERRRYVALREARDAALAAHRDAEGR